MEMMNKIRHPVQQPAGVSGVSPVLTIINENLPTAWHRGHPLKGLTEVSALVANENRNNIWE